MEKLRKSLKAYVMALVLFVWLIVGGGVINVLIHHLIA